MRSKVRGSAGVQKDESSPEETTRVGGWCKWWAIEAKLGSLKHLSVAPSGPSATVLED